MSQLGNDLASLLGESVSTQKTVDLCEQHGKPKEYFHFDSKCIGCEKCFKEKDIHKTDCTSARDWCTKMMERYIDVLDNATYMPCEHIQKEKEYGITWRSAFKAQLHELINDLHLRFIPGDDGYDPLTTDPFVLLHQIVKKDVIDAATFDTRTQADFLVLMLDQLEMLEKTVYMIKSLLKQPEISEFANTMEARMDVLRME